MIGARGQLGSDLVRALERGGRYEVAQLHHDQADVTDPNSLDTTLGDLRPNVVVNCAAFHRVEDCEKEPVRAFEVNALGSLNVARASEKLGAMCVFISSDYVFDGNGAPYAEEDAAAPLNAYGASKVAGEHLLRQSCRRWVVARVASLFGVAGASGKGGNFVETVLSRARAGQPLEVVDDITMSPTYAADAAHALERILAEAPEGTFHVTNAGATSWYGLAHAALNLAGVEADLRPTSASSQTTAARRPRDSSLISRRLPAAAREVLRPWEEALEHYLAEKGHI